MFFAAFILMFAFHKEKKIKGSEMPPESREEIRKELKPPLLKTSDVQPEKPVLASEDNFERAKANPAEIRNEMVEKFFAEIPRLKDLNIKSDEEAHSAPQAVLAAGAFLARMHEYFNNFPQTRSVEMGFYLKCSQQKDFFESVRAVCAARLSQQYFEATGHEISEEIFERRIDSLRKKIIL
jgi:hypothetical protein